MTKYDDGMEVRREVLGDEHVDRATASATEFTRDFQELITEYAWGTDLDPPRARPAQPLADHAHRAGRPRPPRGARHAPAGRAAPTA